MTGARGPTVSVRLALWNMTVLALVLVVLGVAFRYSVRASLTGALDRDMAVHASRAIARWQQIPDYQQSALLDFARRNPVRLRRITFLASILFDTAGAEGVVSGPASAESQFLRPKILDPTQHDLIRQRPDVPWDSLGYAQSLQGKSVFATVQIDSQPVRIYSTPLRRHGQVIGVVQLGRSLAGVRASVQTITRTLLAFILPALLAVGLGSVFLTDRAIRPVRALRQAAQRIGAQHLSERLPVSGDDEFAGLSATFNGMLARLEAAFAQQQRFTADASHELRTPLTVIRGNTSLALAKERTAVEYQEALTRIDRVAAAMSKTVEDLLALARADAGAFHLTLIPILLGDVLTTARDTVTTSETSPIVIELPDSSLTVLGDAGQLTRLFANLLTNAVRHTPATGRVTLRAEASGAAVIVSVRDTGEGIAPEHLPHLGERFYRVDSARAQGTGGTGLGLAISRSIVNAHGGTLEIESTLGLGTTVRVTLPRVPGR